MLLPGRSRVPWMRNPAKPDDTDAIYFQENPNEKEWVGLRTRQWKFVRRTKEDEETIRVLFDLANDPGETRNVYQEHGQIGKKIEKRLDAWLASLEGVSPIQYGEMSERMQKALRDAGYIRD